MTSVNSLHSITDLDNLPFDPKEYSRFKHGSKTIARKYGLELATYFVSHNSTIKWLLESKALKQRVVIIPAAYQFVPTATSALKDYFLRFVNSVLAEMSILPLQELKMYRPVSYNQDYGKMSLEEREQVISSEDFSMDAGFLENKRIIFLDDIRITGSHERRVIKTIEKYGIDASQTMHLYYAKLDNLDINPNVEFEFNQAYVKNLLTLDKVIKNDEFIFNTRVIKYILSAPPSEAVPFLTYQPYLFLENLYHLAVSNSYHLDPNYKSNLTFLKQLIDDDQLS